MDVPVLGEIPIDVSLREGGDTGKPIVESDPTAPAALVLTEIAALVLLGCAAWRAGPVARPGAPASAELSAR